MKRLICLLLALLLPCAALAEYSMAGYDPENVYRNWESNLFKANGRKNRRKIHLSPVWQGG